MQVYLNKMSIDSVSRFALAGQRYRCTWAGFTVEDENKIVQAPPGSGATCRTNAVFSLKIYKSNNGL